MIHVLVCDDSATSRQLLTGILTTDPEVKVVGTAADGVEAVQLTKRLQPHVVTMDIQMPRMTGLEATRHIMALAPTPVVIVSCRLEFEADVAAANGLAAGALAVLEKPRGPALPRFKESAAHFLNTVKTMAGVKVVRLRQADGKAPRGGAPDLLDFAGPPLGRPDRIRVLACDDSPTALGTVVGLLRCDPEVEVVGKAADGAQAVQLAKQVRPDVITMDIHMPEMDGFEATRRIMEEAPTPIVLVSAGLRLGDNAGADPLVARGRASGAVEVLRTPDRNGGKAFLETVKAMARVKLVRRS